MKIKNIDTLLSFEVKLYINDFVKKGMFSGAFEIGNSDFTISGRSTFHDNFDGAYNETKVLIERAYQKLNEE